MIYPTISQIEQIDEALLTEYFSYLGQQGYQPATKKRKLVGLKVFLDLGESNNWFHVPHEFIRDWIGSAHKNIKTNPRFIPDDVLKQLNQHLDALPEPVRRMVLVIQECGLRISELVSLPIDCLKQDSKGIWFIEFTRWKMNKDDLIPISPELALVIQEQQQYVNISGEAIESANPEIDNNSDLQWMSRKVLGEVLPHGYCGLPAQLTCSKGNACLTCSDFRTTGEFLEQHKEHRERTLKVLEKARANNWQRLSEVGIRLNKTLRELIQSAPESQVLNALSVVKEALAVGKVRSKAGLFRKALEEGWEPNEYDEERKINEMQENFSEWFKLAKAQGIVQASQGTKDGIIVLDSTGEWMPLKTMFEKGWTLEHLEQRQNQS